MHNILYAQYMLHEMDKYSVPVVFPKMDNQPQDSVVM